MSTNELGKFIRLDKTLQDIKISENKKANKCSDLHWRA